MGTKLNPDGIKIKALRIKRGWTQEQLAEISGISLRTVQRAEAANSAAFETIKAIAAAFETNFDSLLKQEPDTDADQEPRPPASLKASCSDPVPEKNGPNPPALPVRRIWLTQITAVSALAAGLIIGISLASHLSKHSASRPSASYPVSKAPVDDRRPFNEPQIQNNSPRTVSKPKIVPTAAINAAAPDFEVGGKDHPAFLNEETPAARPADTANTASLDLIQAPSSDLLSLEIVPLPISLPEVPLLQNELPSNSSFSVKETQDTGAVRQAVSLAAKKTSGFVSRARDSIKRAF